MKLFDKISYWFFFGSEYRPNTPWQAVKTVLLCTFVMVVLWISTAAFFLAFGA